MARCAGSVVLSRGCSEGRAEDFARAAFHFTAFVLAAKWEAEPQVHVQHGKVMICSCYIIVASNSCLSCLAVWLELAG